MILSDIDIRRAVLNNHNDYKKNVDYELNLNMIVNGYKYLEYLLELSNLETKQQKRLREKYAKSTKALAANITRPFQNIFTAVGGTKKFIFKKGSNRYKEEKERELITKLKDNSVNGTTDYFMSNIWGARVIDSPRSTILMEISKDGNDKYPVFIAQKFVTNWQYRGLINYEWIVIYQGSYERDKVKYQLYRVIDDAFDYTVIVNENKDVNIIPVNESISFEQKNGIIKEFSTIENQSNEVQALQLTTKIDTDMQNKISLLHPVTELFEEALLDNSILRIFKFLHGYPEYYRISDNVCPECGGQGSYYHDGSTCRSCNGTGSKKKDISDENQVQLPDDKDTPFVLPKDYSAYIAPSIETWAQMLKDRLSNKEDIMYTVWGASIVSDSNKQYSTAVGRFLDVKPINDVLEQYSNIAQLIDKSITDWQASFYFPDDFQESLVLYGNFYLTNTPDQLLEKYQALLTSKASYQDLDRAMLNYLHTIYAKNPLQLKIAIKDLNYEYYRHNTISEVQSFNISDTVKKRKMYYELFRKTLSDGEFMSYKSIEDFNVKLDEFISNFTVGNDTINDITEQTIIN